MDFSYGQNSDFPGCFLSITRTSVDMLNEQHRSKKMAKQRISKAMPKTDVEFARNGFEKVALKAQERKNR
ncbi:hypothetical protein [Ectobacillus funiculus]|uniref:Uncharacterized protein n=1 Tax=Ectobacillus funiculus TaxID=137993 RepID=A0ABV5WGB1_9BACI